ncbi:MAG TPA: hypothetical protein VFO69_09125 [Allosphingosinicella sp.]|nr:hypothetical protein [Allosphingosinicella sp.]
MIAASEIPLPELRAFEGQAAPDLVIRRGAVQSLDAMPGLNVLPDEEALLVIPEVGRYLMREGQEMIVESDPAGSDRNLRLYLLGSAFAAILHQRGLLPLHANSILVDGRAIGFMGHPGAGKSTMAACFHDRGFGILSDDVCVVGSGPMAFAGIPRLRLWREALEASGRSVDGYEMSFDDMDKYNVPIEGDVRGPEQAPLSHLYLLDDAGGSDKSSIIQLRGSAAVEALVANTYRGAYVPLMGRTEAHLLACIKLAREAPVFRVSRRWGLKSLAAEAEAIAAHARAVMSANAIGSV